MRTMRIQILSYCKYECGYDPYNDRGSKDWPCKECRLKSVLDRATRAIAGENPSVFCPHCSHEEKEPENFYNLHDGSLIECDECGRTSVFQVSYSSHHSLTKIRMKGRSC